MPTRADLDELINTSYVDRAFVEGLPWAENSNVKGLIITKKGQLHVTGGSTVAPFTDSSIVAPYPTDYIFIPAAGCVYSGFLSGVGSHYFVWSSSLHGEYYASAWLWFTAPMGNPGVIDTYRYYGFSVRGVQD